MIESPLNYTGGKFKLLPQILPLFPKRIHTFVDLFCGGCNVGLNVTCDRVVYNDSNKKLLHMYNTFKKLNHELILSLVYKVIAEYGLSLISKHGYRYYGCESSKGLGDYNRPKFLKLRTDFNQLRSSDKNVDFSYYVILYVMIVYAFNNQIRFNEKGEFNLPVGKRDFNKKMEGKLVRFIDRLHEQKCTFNCADFRDFTVLDLTSDDFVYVDPPYLITCATYNEKNGWTEKDEKDLLMFLDRLHNKKIRFALSNVLRNKGKENNILINWLDKNATRYRVFFLEHSYSNSSYHTKDKKSSSEEVLIVNYGN